MAILCLQRNCVWMKLEQKNRKKPGPPWHYYPSALPYTTHQRLLISWEKESFGW